LVSIPLHSDGRVNREDKGSPWPQESIRANEPDSLVKDSWAKDSVRPKSPPLVAENELVEKMTEKI